jgi:hypothetical protein
VADTSVTGQRPGGGGGSYETQPRDYHGRWTSTGDLGAALGTPIRNAVEITDPRTGATGVGKDQAAAEANLQAKLHAFGSMQEIAKAHGDKPWSRAEWEAFERADPGPHPTGPIPTRSDRPVDLAKQLAYTSEERVAAAHAMVARIAARDHFDPGLVDIKDRVEASGHLVSGQYDAGTGRIALFLKSGGLDEATLTHEAEHLRYDTVLRAYTGRSPIGGLMSMPREYAGPHDPVTYAKLHPFIGTTAGRTALARDDGVTPYSREYWQGAPPDIGVDPNYWVRNRSRADVALDESLAEVARTRTYPRQGRYHTVRAGAHKTLNTYYDAIQSEYTRLTTGG